MPLRGFNALWSGYPNTEPTSALLDMIFGEKSKKTPGVTINWVLNSGEVTNTCCIRLSHALNSGLNPIIKIGSIEMITGIKGKYILKVSHMSKYLSLIYGKPDVNVSGDSKKFQDAVIGEKGIIVFKVRGWSDASGHIDLWDGKKAKRKEYFSFSSGIQLWKIN